MPDTLQTLLTNQYEAALRTLDHCIDLCPTDPPQAWDMPIANYRFGQLVFHTLFYADYYLGLNEDALRVQPFHRENADVFADYEELEDRPAAPSRDRAFMKRYMDHCRQKAVRVIGAETAESLAAAAQFPRKSFSRAELHVYNIRHIQHHAAQLSLRLRLGHGVAAPWVGSGWRQ
jgi:hypothetical protein